MSKLNEFPSMVFIFSKDREKFASLLSETEDWIYGEGEGQMKQVYVDKLAELKVCFIT